MIDLYASENPDLCGLVIASTSCPNGGYDHRQSRKRGYPILVITDKTKSVRLLSCQGKNGRGLVLCGGFVDVDREKNESR